MNTCSFSSHAPHIHKRWITSNIKKIAMLRLAVRRYETSECRQITSTQDLHKPVRDRSWHQKRSEDKAASELSFRETSRSTARLIKQTNI